MVRIRPEEHDRIKREVIHFSPDVILTVYNSGKKLLQRMFPKEKIETVHAY